MSEQICKSCVNTGMWLGKPCACGQPDRTHAHADDLAVDRFAAAMKAKLAAKRAQGRSGWDDTEQCEVMFLAEELVGHLSKGDPVDVANFAMMLHQRNAGAHVLQWAIKSLLDEARFTARDAARREHEKKARVVTIDGIVYEARGPK